MDDPLNDLSGYSVATGLFGRCTGKSDPNRQRAKQGVHAANYGATPPVIATALGMNIKPEVAAEIATAGASFAGLMLVIFNEKK